ncbi:AAA family ATPase [Methylomonas rapida]|uniref:AAA family ATPase n=1 Tax=Methylomonas rapida TaxID=2963939 RepID=A0ABY7GIH7_9GAMM|nr:AAA family ATPase [Methylomonas rapida]WAR43883.1 AAA family ATPase [Methylomonas rapida]
MLPDDDEFIEIDANPEQSAPKPFPFISAAELTAKPISIPWLLEGYIERGSLNLLFGGPGTGKSLLDLDWGFCVAHGIHWNGCPTEQTDVVVIAGEGFAGMARRLKALEVKHGRPAPERLFISQRPGDLIDSNNAQWIADSIMALCPNPGLIIIDTLHRNMTGDENSSADIGQFVANIDNHLKPLGAAVLIVHHSGHGTAQRSRGSSSIRAAMDAEFSATKDGANVVLTCTKAKDFEAFSPQQFTLKTVDLPWPDDDGEPLKSVVLEHAGDAKPVTAKRRLSARDDAILTALSEAIDKHGVEPSAEIKDKFAGFKGWTNRAAKVVHIDHWRELAYQTITVDCEAEEGKADARKKAFKRCRNKLFDSGFIVEHGDYAWPIFH